MSYLLKNASIVNEGSIYQGSIRIEKDLITEISRENLSPKEGDTVIDLTGKHLMPGLIDDQVHFREPGLTHKAEIFTESRAA
ncbi:MAG: dihydroorotase, partial [Salibacteraceae bacterium]